MNRPCLVAGCPNVTTRTRCTQHQREWNAKRNANPRRRALYNAEWTGLRDGIVAAHPYCVTCGTPNDLTVDHPTLMVLCRSHHSALEARRRRNLGAP